jgi:hypothetical protein
MQTMKRSFQFLGLSLLILFISLSCNRVNFSSQKSQGDPGITAVDPKKGDIQCTVGLNGTQQNVSIVLPGANPSVSAQCIPTAVTYTWSVTKDGSPVTINGLQGADSTNPDFISLGVGVYKIVLRASAQDYNDYTNAASPLTVTITSPTALPNVTCNPKMNGTLTSITLGTGSANPEVKGNCQPVDAGCAWTVTRAGAAVSVPGLSSCTSTPDFSAQAAGTYLIYLTATRSGYNSFTAVNPLTVMINRTATRTVTTTKLVTTQDNQLDVQLVVDDSKSMLGDNQKLAMRLQGFVNDLKAAGFDWQMCVTVTRAQQLTAADPTLYWGASRYWSGLNGAKPWILTPAAPNTYQIFQDTINQIGAGWAGTDDERGIKAAWWHLWNGDVRYNDASGCYRKDAGLATILISDEDERSVGGDQSQEYYAGEYKALEADDAPQAYINLVKEVFGPTKRFAVNSIIVRPGDSACMAQQDTEGSKSHFGTKYNELALSSGGTVGSICDADYSNQLKYFKDQIVRVLGSLPLECAPINGQVTVTIDPAFTTTTRVEGMTLFFDPKVPAGSNIKAVYQCPM